MLSDAQFSRLTHGTPLRRPAAAQASAFRIPYTNAIKLYPLVGKGKFGAAITVRCKELGPAGCSFLTHRTFEPDTTFLLRFPTSIGEKPLNLIGSMVGCERVSSGLNLVAAQFNAVPVDDSSPPAVVAAVAAEKPAVRPPLIETDPLEPVDDITDAEMNRIQKAVLDVGMTPGS